MVNKTRLVVLLIFMAVMGKGAGSTLMFCRCQIGETCSLPGRIPAYTTLTVGDHDLAM